MVKRSASTAKGKPKKAKEFVLDCSVTMAWFFEDETVPYADNAQQSLATARAIVPSLWHLEVANALLMGERRKRTTETKVTRFLTLLDILPITVDEQTCTRAFTTTLTVARVHNRSAYDAAYIELALRRGLPLATLDGPLKAAAAKAGVSLYTP